MPGATCCWVRLKRAQLLSAFLLGTVACTAGVTTPACARSTRAAEPDPAAGPQRASDSKSAASATAGQRVHPLSAPQAEPGEPGHVGTASQPAPAARAPGPPRSVDLKVPGHRAAVLSIPPGTSPAPVLIATHGAGDRAEEHCAHWAARVGQDAFVLCPRGVPMTRHPQTGYFFRHHHALGEEIQDALAELRVAHPRADTKGMVLAGYSQGSIMGALHAHTVPDQIARLLLVEGGFDEWDVGTAKRYLAAGGKRVALVCGITHCAQRAKHAHAALKRGGVPVQSAYVAGGGHTYAGRVGEQAAALLPWLVQDDKRWDAWRQRAASEPR